MEKYGDEYKEADANVESRRGGDGNTVKESVDQESTYSRICRARRNYLMIRVNLLAEVEVRRDPVVLAGVRYLNAN